MSAGKQKTSECPCDLCGGDVPLEIACARLYTRGQPVHVCGQCGLVLFKSGWRSAVRKLPRS